MLEAITALSLATAAGLNAYIPLLGIGLLSRFTGLLDLPEGWAWLESSWSLWTLGALLAIEVIVDKVPALDTVNDVLQSVVRPASGGLVFSAGVASESVAVTDPQAFADASLLWPFVWGVLIALVPHIAKLAARPVLNVATAGAGAAVASTVEDTAAVVVTVLAVVVPVVALGVIVLIVLLAVRAIKRVRRRRATA